MRKTILVLLALLLATGAYAQIGSPPGISSAPPQITGGTFTAGTITGQTNATGAVFTGATPFCFEGATDNAFETCIGVADPVADRTITIPLVSASNTQFFVLGANQTITGGVPTYVTSSGLTGNPSFAFNAAYNGNNNAQMSVYGMNAVSWFDVTVSAADSPFPTTSNFQVYPFGSFMTSWYGSTQVVQGDVPDQYIPMGPWPSVADGSVDTIALTVVDTAPSITTGYVTVCGSTRGVQESIQSAQCERIDISAGAAGSPYTSTLSYYNIASIKTTGMVGLGGAGNEKISAAWSTDSAGTFLAATNLVEQAPIVATGFSPMNGPGNYMACADLVGGCSVTLGDPGALGSWETLLTAKHGTFTFTDGATQQFMGSPRILSEGETMTVVFHDFDRKWYETGGATPLLKFEGSTANAFETTVTVTDPTADRTVTLQNASGTVLLSTTANEFDTGNAFWVNTGALVFEGSTANAYETTVNVLDPTAARTISFPDSPGIVEVRSQAATSGMPGNIYAMMVEGGYALDGTLTTTPASTVTVTLADPEADSAPTQNVLICGYENATNKVLYVLSCVILAATEGAGNVTVPTFVEITNVKGQGKGGDDADDTIAVEFTTGPVSIRSATALADSAKSDITPSAAINGSAIALYCADFPAAGVGCDFQPGDPGSASDGKTLILMVKTGSAPVTVVDDDTLVELDGDANVVLDDNDTLMLIWNDANSKWLQVGQASLN